MENLNAAAAVDYTVLDFYKALAQQAGARTDGNIRRFGFEVFEPSRGASAFLIREQTCFRAFVMECLGTKIEVADEMEKLTGVSRHDDVAQCAGATIVNDMTTVGAFPTVIAQFAAVGHSSYFQSTKRRDKLIAGWESMCGPTGANCVWGPGETPELQGLINPHSMVLAGAAQGITRGFQKYDEEQLRAGDILIGAESSGVHANSLTAYRRLAKTLPQGYLTKVPGIDRCFGDVLLDKTHLYCSLVEALAENQVEVHFIVNGTGHGWRKFARARKPFRYIFHTLPTENPIFSFIRWKRQFTDQQMYAGPNMGLGYLFAVAPRAVDRFFEVGKRLKLPYPLFVAGEVQASDEKELKILPKNIIYNAKDLTLF